MRKGAEHGARRGHANTCTRSRTLVLASLSPVLTAVAALLAAGAAASLARSAAPFSAAPAAAARALARSMKESPSAIALLQKAQLRQGAERQGRAETHAPKERGAQGQSRVDQRPAAPLGASLRLPQTDCRVNIQNQAS